ncbi:DUF488 domain-containing protein [Limosilactobacillus sp.]|jgi:uncharacterized protein YeaO (DUF488 family)|uniref:DUF488 domain-containing protein n=1 Tax=Limosilactobacillus sp. TaxID=2773925 RepID=UPI0025B8A12A|nr:DUF488 family protein [Limosilactobacillus sp.]MCH3921532.1 DUF488 family protein [Limosilactobacillus sp.]MCH3928303.1 DUF488 family protein [Limosilactobacillus sp.]
MELKIERIYTKPADLNGYRILVDRLWPRGIFKDNAHLDSWLKEVGPSTELRKWFGHDPAKYAGFKERYLQELAANPAYDQLKDLVSQQLPKQNVILLYGAKDEQHNQAVILRHQLVADLKLEQ